jgi:hypothetical protein
MTQIEENNGLGLIRSTEKFPKIEELENVEIRLYASGMESNFTLGLIIEPFILIFHY